jgi:hypothetical protein
MHLLQKEKNKRKSVAVMEVDQREKGRLLGVVQTCGSSKEWSRQAREREGVGHTRILMPWLAWPASSSSKHTRTRMNSGATVVLTREWCVLGEVHLK